MASPLTVVFDQIWKLLDDSEELSELIKIKYRLRSREYVPSNNPTSGQLPDLLVLFLGGPINNLVTSAQWRPEITYDVVSRTDSMNARLGMDICWEVAKALTSQGTNYNLQLAGTVTHVDFAESTMEKEPNAERWLIHNPLTVNLCGVP